MHLGACGVAAGVHDPRTAVPALDRSGQRAVGVPVEPGAVSDQIGDALRAFLDEQAHCVRVAEGSACHVGVACMIGRIIVAERGCYAALRPWRTAVAGGDDKHATGFRQPESGGQPGDARTDDEDVDVSAHSPPPGLPSVIIFSTARRAAGAMSAGTVTSSRPSRKQRSNSSGVVIFMNRHDAFGFIGRKFVCAFTLRNWCSMPISVATSAVPARHRARGIDHAAGGQDARSAGRQVTLAGQPDRRRRAAALRVHEQLGVRMRRYLAADIDRADAGVHVTFAEPDLDVGASGLPAYVRAEELVGQEQHRTFRRNRLDDLDRIRRGAADVGFGLHRGSRVHVRDDCRVRMLGLPGADLIGGDGVGE